MVAASNLEEPLRMTEAEYLAFEEQSEIKHEFVNGEVFAMTGASTNHNLICSNTIVTLGSQLADKDCFVLTSDTRVKVQSKRSYRYPDITIICGQIQHFNNRVDTVINPTVLIEVLSPSTAVVDLNQKFDEYTQIASLQEYVIIAQDETKIRRFLRQDSGDWLLTQAIGLDTSLELPSLGCRIALADIYRKVTFDLPDDTE
jgi:Uma2 family endonuclease